MTKRQRTTQEAAAADDNDDDALIVTNVVRSSGSGGSAPVATNAKSGGGGGDARNAANASESDERDSVADFSLDLSVSSTRSSARSSDDDCVEHKQSNESSGQAFSLDFSDSLQSPAASQSRNSKFAALQELRKRRASEQCVAVTTILSDALINQLLQAAPRSIDAVSAIIGSKRAASLGADILKVLEA